MLEIYPTIRINYPNDIWNIKNLKGEMIYEKEN